jgi:lysophospholipase L1-like esterase
LSQDTELVTLTVGAADLNLSGVLAACTAEPPVGCEDAIDVAVGQLGLLGGSLTSLYAQVAEAAPNALIVVTGYPHLFEIVPGIRPRPSRSESTAQSRFSMAPSSKPSLLRTLMSASCTSTWPQSSRGMVLAARSLSSNPAGSDAYHPNVAGYRAYAKAIFAAIRSAGLVDNKQVA